MDVVEMFAIPVARVALNEAVEHIVEMAKAPRTAAKTIATLNVDFVCNAVASWPFKGNAELWEYLKKADFVTADGMPLVLLAKLLRKPVPGRVTGADLVPALCKRFAAEGLSIYILGESGGVGEKELSGVKIAGIDGAFVKLGEDRPEIIERINAAHPDLLFVALGNPKQELWIARNAAKLRVGAVIGVGGTFNFIAGKVKRAPMWMQKCGLEWIWRVFAEPRRLWKRYAYGLVKFPYLSIKEILR